jgi:hypothetical protein
MSLAPSEQHILAEIETRLRRSDPSWPPGHPRGPTPGPAGVLPGGQQLSQRAPA